MVVSQMWKIFLFDVKFYEIAVPFYVLFDSQSSECQRFLSYLAK